MEINIYHNSAIEKIKVKRINYDTIEINYADDIEIEENDIMSSLREIDHLTTYKTLKRLVIFGEFSYISIPVIKILANENLKRNSQIIVEAFVITSISVRLFVNVYLNELTNNHKMKVFKNELDAKNWLNNQ